MDKMVLESSDEDDTYISSVARLKAMRKKRLENEKLARFSSNKSPVISVAVKNNENDVIITSNDVVPDNITNESVVETQEIETQEIESQEIEIQETETRLLRSKTRENRGKTRGRGCHTNYLATRSTRRRSFPNNLECNGESISLEDSCDDVSESSKNDDIIALSSDDDVCSNDDVCSDDDNYEIDIKVLWRSVRLDRLRLHRRDTFSKVFQHYADLEKVSVNEILIMRNDKVVSFNDTPASLNLSVIDILDGGIVNPGMSTLLSENKDNNENDACSIKVQTANKRQSMTVPHKKNQQFQMLFSYCASELRENESNLKFYFDGELINPTDTPESLDMEAEACIDLRITSV